MKAAIAVLILAVGLAQSAAEPRVIDDAARALGGRERILALRNMQVDGEGLATDVGQQSDPGGDKATWQVTAFSRRIDLISGRMQTQQHRAAKFPFPGDNAPRFDEVVDGSVEMFHHPLTLIRAALEPGAKVEHPRQAGRETLVDITTRGGHVLTLSVDRESNLPTRITSTADYPNLGDVVVTTTFDGYEEVGGLKMPTHITTDVDRYRQFEIRTTRNSLNGVMTLAAPVAAGAATFSFLVVTPQPIGRGIWSIEGSDGYRSVVFEFADHLTLFGVAFSEQHSKAVIDAARRLSSKPLTQVIIPSNHSDEAAGLRVAVAEGLTVIAYRTGVDTFRDLVARPHSIAPDALAREPRLPRFVAVDDAMTLRDQSMEVRLYHVKDNPREAANLFAYVPRDRLLIQAGLYDATWHQHPWGANVLWNLEQRKLTVERDVPEHGPIESYGTMAKTIYLRAGGRRRAF